MKPAEDARVATEARDVAVVVASEARSFVEEKSLARELDAALEIAKECLTGTTRIRVALVEDPEEEDSPPAVVLRLENLLSQPDFWDARKRFYRSVRGAGLVRLCENLAVVRD